MLSFTRARKGKPGPEQPAVRHKSRGKANTGYPEAPAKGSGDESKGGT